MYFLNFKSVWHFKVNIYRTWIGTNQHKSCIQFSNYSRNTRRYLSNVVTSYSMVIFDKCIYLKSYHLIYTRHYADKRDSYQCPYMSTMSLIRLLLCITHPYWVTKYELQIVNSRYYFTFQTNKCTNFTYGVWTTRSTKYSVTCRTEDARTICTSSILTFLSVPMGDIIFT